MQRNNELRREVSMRFYKQSYNTYMPLRYTLNTEYTDSLYSLIVVSQKYSYRLAMNSYYNFHFVHVRYT